MLSRGIHAGANVLHRTSTDHPTEKVKHVNGEGHHCHLHHQHTSQQEMAQVIGKRDKDADHEDNRHAEAAVFYLEAVSHLHLEDDLAVLHHIQAHPGATGSLGADIRHFRHKRDKLYDTIGNIDGMVRIMSVIDSDLSTRACVTPVMQRAMDERIFSPFSMTTATIDAALHLLLIVAFRLGPAAAIFHLEEQTFHPHWYLVWILLCWLSLIHFAAKEIRLGIIRYALSPRLFWGQLFTFWNQISITPIFMVAYCTILVNHHIRQRLVALRGGGVPEGAASDGDEDNEESIPFNLRVIVAFTTPFLWLRVLGHIKTWNEQLATFILASVHIIEDIKFVSVFLLLVCTLYVDPPRCHVFVCPNARFSDI
eukprot:scaffold42414_cov168-Amphora_coffeaeformis.AAC.1